MQDEKIVEDSHSTVQAKTLPVVGMLLDLVWKDPTLEMLSCNRCLQTFGETGTCPAKSHNPSARQA